MKQVSGSLFSLGLVLLTGGLIFGAGIPKGESAVEEKIALSGTFRKVETTSGEAPIWTLALDTPFETKAGTRIYRIEIDPQDKPAQQFDAQRVKISGTLVEKEEKDGKVSTLILLETIKEDFT